MKLSFTTLLATAFIIVDGFTIPQHRRTTSTTSSSSTVLFDSRARQKYASRTKWLEKRGIDPETGLKKVGPTDPGRTKNEDGLEFVRLVHPSGASSEIYLLGGDVTSYKDKTGHEFIAVRPDAKMDGSKPISGGLSHCWPQFGPGKIQQHGFARNVDWLIDELTDTSVTLSLWPDMYTRDIWGRDKQFRCQFTVEIDEDELRTTNVVENTAPAGSDSTWEFQAALHSYFTVSGINDLEIGGSFEGREFLNKMVGEGEMQTEDRSSITINEEYDRVYMGVSDPVLKDKGSKKTLTIQNNQGYEDTVLWNPYGDEGMGYNNFVCVESVKFDPVPLAPGEKWEGVMNLIPGVLEVEETAAVEEVAAEEEPEAAVAEEETTATAEE